MRTLCKSSKIANTRFLSTVEVHGTSSVINHSNFIFLLDFSFSYFWFYFFLNSQFRRTYLRSVASTSGSAQNQVEATEGEVSDDDDSCIAKVQFRNYVIFSYYIS